MAVRYKMRINVRTLTNGSLYSYVSMSDDVAAMFTKPYVSVKRMQDRLAFCQWDKKTGQGTVKVGKNSLQFGVQEDCEKIKDFCGQYYLVNKTDSEIVFVKLADRHPFDKEVGEYNSSPHDKCSELPKEAPHSATLAEMIDEAIKRKQGEVDRAAEEVVAAENILKDAKERFDKLSEELSAYYTVLRSEQYFRRKGGE